SSGGRRDPLIDHENVFRPYPSSSPPRPPADAHRAVISQQMCDDPPLVGCEHRIRPVYFQEFREGGRRYMSRLGNTMRALLVAVVCVAPLACSGDDRGVTIRGLTTNININPSAAPNTLYFVEDSSSAGNVVVVNVMLESDAGLQFDAINLHFIFDPSIIQVSILPLDRDPQGSIAPFGECSSSTAFCPAYPCPPTHEFDDPTDKCCLMNDFNSNTGMCDTPAMEIIGTDGPFCLDNSSAASVTGDLLTGMAAGQSGLCASYDQGGMAGTILLLRLMILGAAAGESELQIISLQDTGMTGDCSVLNGSMDLGIVCDDGGAIVTVSR
ncbi:MAG: hypothetical protein O7A63_02580, partial [Acidobacteria bacterium]|nr:hypothetical protein [Acidobacteriota bacterium]